jgi:hypothetical protein
MPAFAKVPSVDVRTFGEAVTTAARAAELALNSFGAAPFGWLSSNQISSDSL